MYGIPSANIIILGPSGSGKTVLLGTMYHKLSTQGDWGFFLEVDDEKRKILTEIYKEVVTKPKSEWPEGTQAADDEGERLRFTFTCCIIKNGKKYRACEFVYLDYAGGYLTDSRINNPDFDQYVENAHVLLVLLDGERICDLFSQKKEGLEWVTGDLQGLLVMITDKAYDKPVHFVISKWDMLQRKEYSLKEVVYKLLENDAFRNLAKTRVEDTDKQLTTRFIPVSSFGQDFAIPLDGVMERIPGKLPKPFQIEVPLACVLPELIEKQKKGRQEEESRTRYRSTTITPSLTKQEEFSQNLPEFFRNWPGLKKWSGSAEQKKKEAKDRSAELRRQQAADLEKIGDVISALKSVLSSFQRIENKFIYNFPECDLKEIYEEFKKSIVWDDDDL